MTETQAENDGEDKKLKWNYPLLLLIATIPLQNIYLGKLPSIGPGLNYLNIMFLLSIFVWKFRKELSIGTKSSLNVPIILFILIYIFSVFISLGTFGQLPDGNIQALKDIVLGIILYFITLNSVRDKSAIYATLVATVVPLPYMFRVFYNQYQSVSSVHFDNDMRIVAGTFMELGSNELGAFYAGYTLVLIMVCLTIKDWRIRVVLGGLIALNLYSLLFTFSRGSWLSFLAGGLLIMFFMWRKILIIFLLVMVIGGGSLLPFLPIAVQERFATIFVDDESERDESAASRFVLWGIAFEKYKESPIFGIGFRVFPYVNPYEGKDTHNYFVKILTEQGAVGIALLLLVLYRAFKIAWSLFNKAVDPLYKNLGLGVMGMMVAFMLGNMVGDRFSHYPVIAYFWVYLALAQRALILTEKNQPAVEPKSVFDESYSY